MNVRPAEAVEIVAVPGEPAAPAIVHADVPRLTTVIRVPVGQGTVAFAGIVTTMSVAAVVGLVVTMPPAADAVSVADVPSAVIVRDSGWNAVPSAAEPVPYKTLPLASTCNRG